MATRQQIRNQIRSIINEPDPTNSHFLDSDLNGFIDQAVMFSAMFIEYPRDFVDIQVEFNVGSYLLISDSMMIRTAYFGDKNITGDIQPLIVISEETLKELYPSWLDETSTANTGVPRYLIQLDRRRIYVHPRPDIVSSAAGKRIILDYIFQPKPLGAEGDSPELPVPYHNFLQFFAAHLIYLKLSDPKMADYMKKQFTDGINALKPTVEKETKEGMMFQWGFDEGVNADANILGLVIS